MAGGEEEAGMTGNSHMHAPVDGHAKSHENHTSGGSAPKEEHSKTKEKSVLQAKLTKLAIQIGYAGKVFVGLVIYFPTWCYCPVQLSLTENISFQALPLHL